jgi:predicted Zn-dependent peptidase
MVKWNALILDEYENIKQNGIEKNEIERAKALIRSEIAFSRDGSYSIASALNESIAIGDWKFYTTYNENIAQVTTTDIKNVANKYLIEDQSTTGYFIPETNGGETKTSGAQNAHQPLNYRPENFAEQGIVNENLKFGNGSQPSSSIASQTVTSNPVGGLKLKTMKTPVQDVVTITGSMFGGDEFSPETNKAVAELTAEMLEEGTTKHNKFEISEKLESVGASLSFSSDKYRVRFSARCLQKDVSLVIELLGEQLRYPVFNESDLENLKKRRVGNLQRAKENTRAQAGGKFSRIIYPENHPNYSREIDEEIADVEKTTVTATYVFLTPGTDHGEVERLILDEYENIKQNGIEKNEIERAKALIRSEIAFSRDGSYSIASALNESIAIGDWKFYTTYNENIAQVTATDIKNVANKYLIEDQSTTGYFIPETNGGETKTSGAQKAHQPLNYRPENFAEQGAVNENLKSSNGSQPLFSIASQTVTSNPAGGLKLKTMKTPVQDVVTITGSMFGGDEFSPETNKAVAELTAEMLEEGTTKHNKFEISEKLESVGASLSFSSDKYRVRFSARCLQKDVSLVIELLGEQLRYPVFNESDLENLKKRRVGNLQRAKENTRAQAGGKFSRIIYPENHPNYSREIDEEIADVEKTTVTDISSYHKNNYGLGKTLVVAVGDVDNDVLSKSLQKALGDWRQLDLEIPARNISANDINSTTQYITMEDKTSVDMFLGLPIGIDRKHDDYYALMVGNYILGGNFAARLMQTVRDQMGLTYGIYSSVRGVNDDNDGYWSIWGTFAPNLLQDGKTATVDQVSGWISGVTEDELNAKKETITGSYKVGMATTGGLAGQILRNAERGYEDEMLDQYPSIIQDISLEEVNTAIKKYIDPKKLVIVAAGSVDETGKPLDK